MSPSDSNLLYLTSEVNGLWYTENLRAPSPTFDLATSYPFRHPQRVFYNPHDTSEIWVTSFGAGLRVGSTSTGMGGGGVRPGLSRVSARLTRRGAEVEFGSVRPGTGLAVFDAMGRIVHLASARSGIGLRWSTGSARSGVYQCRLSGTGTTTTRVVIVE